MIGSPLSDIGVKAFSIPHNRRQKLQIATLFALSFEPPRHFIPRLRFHRDVTIRTKLRAQPRKQQPDKMIYLRDRRDRAFAAATARPLLDADRRRNTRNEIYVWPRKLLDELPRINIHRIQESALPFGKQKIKRQRALPRTADPGHNNEATARNVQRKILYIMLPRAVNGDRVARGSGQF